MFPLLLSCSPDHPDTEPGDGGIGIAVVSIDSLVLAKRIVAALDEPALLTLRCSTSADAHTWTSQEDTANHELLLAGLLANQLYSCTANAGDQQTTFTLHTDPLPDAVSKGFTVEGSASPAYTLFNYARMDGNVSIDDQLVVVDELGRVRWYWFTTANLASTFVDDGFLAVGGGMAPTMVEIDHTLRFESTDERWFHHALVPLEDDQIYTLAEVTHTDGTTTWEGFEVLRWDLTTDSPTWSWNSQMAFDAGWLPAPTTGTDPWHANAILPLGDHEDPRLLLVSLRNLHGLLALDPESGEIQWKLRRGGDFTLWDDQGNPLDTADWFAKPHAAEGWPDLLVFDNGLSTNPTDTVSRGLRLHIDEDAKTATINWQFNEDGWNTPVYGDADLQTNGHVLLTYGHCRSCGTGNPDGRSRIVEVDPQTNEVVWRLDFEGEEDAIYRSQRISGCALFHRDGSCG